MKMKATLENEKLHSTQTALFFPSRHSDGLKNLFNILNTDFRQTAQQYGPTVLTVDIVTASRGSLFCTAKLKAVGMDYSLTAQQFNVPGCLCFWLTCAGKGCPVTLLRHPSKGVAGRRHHDPCANSGRPSLSGTTSASVLLMGREEHAS